VKRFLSCMILLWSQVYAQDISVVIPYSAGGPTDQVTRTLLKHLTHDVWRFVPEYRLGAGGVTAANWVAASSSPALMITSNALTISPVLTADIVKYDLSRDLVMVEYLGTEPLILTVAANSGIQHLRDWRMIARQKPMAYGSAGVGTSGHIASAILANGNGSHIHVPYKGSAGLVVDLLNGSLQWVLDSRMNVGVFLDEGRLRALAIHGRQRVVGMPQVATVHEQGLDDRGFFRWHILVANTRVDPALVSWLRQRLSDPAVRRDLQNLGLDSFAARKPQDFFATESALTQRILKDFSIRP
jgi:tripartite-type tricarboxylate transporter receptor subunit TctC